MVFVLGLGGEGLLSERPLSRSVVGDCFEGCRLGIGEGVIFGNWGPRVNLDVFLRNRGGD